MSQRRGPIWNPNIPLPVWDLWIGAAEVMVAGERIALARFRSADALRVDSRWEIHAACPHKN